MRDHYKGMPRLQRWMENIHLARSIPIDENGKFLTLAEAMVLLDPAHHDHEAIFKKMSPLLPVHVKNDFDMLRSLRRGHQVREVESTLNRLRVAQLNVEEL